MLKQQAGGARQMPFQKKILQGSDKMLLSKLPLILSTNAAWDGPGRRGGGGEPRCSRGTMGSMLAWGRGGRVEPFEDE